MSTIEKKTVTASALPAYSQGVCKDGAAVLKDGQRLTVEEILQALREREELFAAYKELDDLVVKEYGWLFGKYSSFAEAYDELEVPACMPPNPSRY